MDWKSFNGRTTLAFLLVICLVGCSRMQLRVTSDPPGSTVTVAKPKAKNPRTGPAPLQVRVKFANTNDIYLVDIKPTDDRFATNQMVINEETFKSLPVDKEKPKVRILNVTLYEKQFVVMPYIEIVLDAKRNWRGVITKSRSFKDVSEAGGSVPTQIIDFGENIGMQSMAIAPDGKRIVYSLASYNTSVEDIKKLLTYSEPRAVEVAGANLFAVSTTIGGIEHITSENFRDLFPSFTPDGQQLLFSSNRRRAGAEDILMISAVRRSGISDVYVHRDARIMRPTQSEDGTVAFAVDEPNPIDASQRFTIWTLGGPHHFPTQIQIGSQPAISPDGKRIAFIGKDSNLWVVNSDGSQATQLTSGAPKILERYRSSLGRDEAQRFEWFMREFSTPERIPFSTPTWSRDGRFIVYTAMEGSDATGRPNEDIWIMQYDGSSKQQLTTNGSIDRYPLIAPDGKWIYFMSNRGGRWGIWRIQAPELAITRAQSVGGH